MATSYNDGNVAIRKRGGVDKNICVLSSLSQRGRDEARKVSSAGVVECMRVYLACFKP